MPISSLPWRCGKPAMSCCRLPLLPRRHGSRRRSTTTALPLLESRSAYRTLRKQEDDKVRLPLTSHGIWAPVPPLVQAATALAPRHGGF